jgi:Fe-S-cluster containining protein
MKIFKLNNTKLGRLINSFINQRIKDRVGTCEPTKCETLTGEKGAACCKLGYRCPALKNNHNCAVYSIRSRNCKVFPANEEDLKLVKNCSYKFI